MRITQLEKILSSQLEQETFEEFLENFDLSPWDVFLLAYEEGLINEELLKSYIASDN
jgi:hypothetical protein